MAASSTGRWIELTGAVWLVYELTGSPVLLGLLGIARAVPAILLSPIAGVVVDRVDQRRLLFLTQGSALLTSLSLGVLVATGNVEYWHVFVQAVMQASISSFDASVRQALFPRLVPRHEVVEAVTLHSTAVRLSQLVGPAIGGLAIAGVGVAAPFLLNAGSYVVLMAGVVLMRDVVHVPKASASFRGELIEGARHILGVPVLSGLLKLEVAFSLFSMNPVMIAIVAREVLGVGPERFGGLLAAPAAGSLVGITSLLLLGSTARQGRFVVYCSLTYAAVLAVFALSGDYAFSFAALVLMGLLDSLVTVTRQSIMQLAAPSRMRGRVMANVGAVTRGVSPLAQTQSGVFAGALGAPSAVIVAALAMAVAAGVTARTNPALWDFSRDDAVREADEVAAVPPPGIDSA